MTDEQMRVAIAECCGWKHLEADEAQDGFRDEDGVWHNMPPDYPNDLNAMHEAEKTLDEISAYEYANALDCICGETRFLLCHATARQKSEAFLRTVGKWTYA